MPSPYTLPLEIFIPFMKPTKESCGGVCELGVTPNSLLSDTQLEDLQDIR